MAVRLGRWMRIDAADLAHAVNVFEQLGEIDIATELSAQFAAFGDLVISTARGLASSKIETLAAATLEASTHSQGVDVMLPASLPFALGAEFGAGQNIFRKTTRRGRMVLVRGWNQFKPRAGADVGYFLFPGVEDVMEAREDDPLLDALVDWVEGRLAA